MATTTLFTQVDIDNLEYKAPRQNQSGGKTVFVSTVPDSNDFQHRLRFQMSEDQETGLQTALFGVSNPMPGQEDKRRALDLSIDSEQLMAFLARLDKHNVAVAVKNSQEWFKKQLDHAQVESMYIPLVKQPPPDTKFKPTVRTKLKVNEQYNSNVWLADGTANVEYRRGLYTDIFKGSKCMAIVETSGLWFASRTFGMSLVVSDILVWPNDRQGGINSFLLAPGTKLAQTKEADKCDDTIMVDCI